ncbi:MAG: thymidine phosphorylase [Chloroflexi bacterium]|nr:thymidine phosphorylase [Chloroflexota bacterium]
MNSVAIIGKKRDGIQLDPEEIRFFIDGYNRGEIPDYQASAWCMAVYMRGMSYAETSQLTQAMVDSGEVLDFSDVVDRVVDKHSTGGVGDKTTLAVLPMVAACGVPVAKMSGRGLAFTGGTLDKLESISGFNTQLSRDQFKTLLRDQGIVIAGQTGQLAPADGKLYAIRDVTGTVSSIPLIASSIMSKKIAGGATAIVLDVKVGLGAFMQRLEDAEELAKTMIRIGEDFDMEVTALISDMNQPLGNAVGNALEVREAIDTLRWGGPADFVEHSLVIAGHMLRLAGVAQDKDLKDARAMLQEKLSNGEAWNKFCQMVENQGGDIAQINNPDLLPRAPIVQVVEAERSGYLQTINSREVGLAALHLGAGRYRKEDPVDHGVGLEIWHKVGDFVEKGQPLFTIHARTESAAEIARHRVGAAHVWSERPGMPLFYNTLFTETERVPGRIEP